MQLEIKTVAIIGLGYIGVQIARRLGSYPFNLNLYDVNKEILEKTKSLVKRAMRLRKKEDIFGDIRLFDTIQEAVADADLIIEAVPENLDLKRKVFAMIDELAPPECILATNSSSLPVSRMEDVVERKDKLLNIHFYAPVWQRDMADIMKGTFTSEQTFQKGIQWITDIGATPLVVKKECMGFVFNRIWHAIKKECLKIWAGGFAEIETVDTAWKIWSGMGMGPFKMMDGVGLDVVYDIEMQYYKESGYEGDCPPKELKDKVERGELGQKTGKGFY